MTCKMNNPKKLVSILLSAVSAIGVGSKSMADPPGGSGGGHRYGLDAASVLKLVPEEIRHLGTDLVTPKQLDEIDNIANSNNTLVMMVDKSPVSCSGGIQQNGTAFSSSGNSFHLIAIYTKDWEDMKGNLEEEIPFMAHEIAVLKGWESTGQYGKISAALRNRIRDSGLKSVSNIQGFSVGYIFENGIRKKFVSCDTTEQNRIAFYKTLGVRYGTRPSGSFLGATEGTKILSGSEEILISPNRVGGYQKFFLTDDEHNLTIKTPDGQTINFLYLQRQGSFCFLSIDMLRNALEN